MNIKDVLTQEELLFLSVAQQEKYSCIKAQDYESAVKIREVERAILDKISNAGFDVLDFASLIKDAGKFSNFSY